MSKWGEFWPFKQTAWLENHNPLISLSDMHLGLLSQWDKKVPREKRYWQIYSFQFQLTKNKQGLNNSSHLYTSEPLADGRNSWNEPAAYCLLSSIMRCYTRTSSPEKAVTTHVKIKGFFSCVWYLQTAAFRLMKMEAFCQNFFGWRRIKHWKIRIAYRQWHSNFPRRGRKRKTGNYVFSGFGNGISRCWERKSTTEILATGRFWPCTWKIFFVISGYQYTCVERYKSTPFALCIFFNS